jgi:hypothetical protein
MDINYEEWTKALEEATRNDNANTGFTSAELCEILHMSAVKMQLFLRAGIKSGKIVVGKRDVLKDWDGRHRQYVVYTLVK